MADIKYEIKEELGVLSENSKGWKKELKSCYNTQNQFNKYSIHSGNLYQVFTYVKNLEANNLDSSKIIAGMLLYAKTVEQIQPDNEYHMSGNKISVRTLDLNQDFAQIASTLDGIVDNFFLL